MKGIQVLSFLATLLIIPEIKAQKAEPELIKALDEFVVVGSRHQERSSADSPVPVDVIDQDDFLNQGYTQMDSLLAVVIPSFNVNAQPVADSPGVSARIAGGLHFDPSQWQAAPSSIRN